MSKKVSTIDDQLRYMSECEEVGQGIPPAMSLVGRIERLPCLTCCILPPDSLHSYSYFSRHCQSQMFQKPWGLVSTILKTQIFHTRKDFDGHHDSLIQCTGDCGASLRNFETDKVSQRQMGSLMHCLKAIYQSYELSAELTL